jgi:phospholipid-binding lipoprotein MlaA
VTTIVNQTAGRDDAPPPGRSRATPRSSEGSTMVRFVVVVTMLAGFTLAGCSVQNNRSNTVLAGGSRTTQSPADPPAAGAVEQPDYDPWESFNERTFWFNYEVLDRYGLKPAAKAWNRIVPYAITRGLDNAFENLDMPARFTNDVLQGRLQGANRELTRFLVNSTIGVAGFFDVATSLGWESHGADMGQTLGTYGVSPGPYLIVPLMYPFTVRDGIGYAFDSLLDPIGFIAPLAANVARSAARRINERARNVDTYEQVEESTLDIYAAVRNAYLQRRAKSVRRAITERDGETSLMWRSLRGMLFLEDDSAGDDGEICRDPASRPPTHSCSQPADSDII